MGAQQDATLLLQIPIVPSYCTYDVTFIAAIAMNTGLDRKTSDMWQWINVVSTGSYSLTFGAHMTTYDPTM